MLQKEVILRIVFDENFLVFLKHDSQFITSFCNKQDQTAIVLTVTLLNKSPIKTMPFAFSCLSTSFKCFVAEACRNP